MVFVWWAVLAAMAAKVAAAAKVAGGAVKAGAAAVAKGQGAGGALQQAGGSIGGKIGGALSNVGKVVNTVGSIGGGRAPGGTDESQPQRMGFTPDQSGLDPLSSSIGSSAGGPGDFRLPALPPESRLGLSGISEEDLRRRFLERR